MNQDRFQQMIDAFGGEPARWPAADRAAAELYLAALPDARAALAEAHALDQALDAWVSPSVSAALREQILARAPMSSMIWAWPKLWLSGAGLAAACAAGAVVGATLIGPSLANAFPSERGGEAAGLLSDGISAFGAPLDAASDEGTRR
jgi:hypothetical protein